MAEILNDLQTTVSEAIIFENLKRTAEKLGYLEELDKDHWVTTAWLCKKIESLERNIQKLEKEIINQTNEHLTIEVSNLNKRVLNLERTQNEILKLLKNYKF